MPATKGNLVKWKLIGTDDTVASKFQLPEGYKNNKPQDAPQSALHRRGGGYSRTQLSSMVGLVREYGELATMFWDDPSAKTLPLDMDSEFQLGGPEFLLHGSTSDWDTLYTSGGLKPTGTNPSLDDHVFSSATNRTAYVSGTRELATAKNFAKKTGWIYLFYVFEGAINFNNTRHRQAEVLAVGDVPTRDMLLIRDLSETAIVYQNLDYRATIVNEKTLAQAFRFIGGGDYPKDSIFWVKA